MAKVGEKAPSFMACDTNLKAVTNESFSGKTVVLSFFPAAFSGGPEEGCEMQLCAMGAVASEADKEKTLFYGISGDLPFANGAYAKKLELPFELLSDAALTSCDKYVGKCDIGAFFKEHGISSALEGAVTTNRGCVVINGEGEVVYSFSGDGHPGKMPDLAAVKKLVLS